MAAINLIWPITKCNPHNVSQRTDDKERGTGESLLGLRTFETLWPDPFFRVSAEESIQMASKQAPQEVKEANWAVKRRKTLCPQFALFLTVCLLGLLGPLANSAPIMDNDGQ